MTLKLPDAEIERRANLVRTNLVAMPPNIHLFKNNITPDENTILSDFTEADFNGYALAALDFTTAAAMVGHVANVTPPSVLWTKAAGGTGNDIYGYYVTDNTNAVLLWSERDPSAPVNMNVDAATYTVTAKWTGTDQ